MAKKFQNLTVDYKKLLNFSASDRAAMAKSEYGQSILSSLTPTQYASLFPTYYKDRLPDISGFTAASRAGGLSGGTRTGYEPSTAPTTAPSTAPTTGGSRQKTTTTTATAGRATPSYIRRLKEASGGVDISDPKAKAQLSSEKKAVFDLLKKGQISADDPRVAFLKDISERDLQKMGLSTSKEKDKTYYKATEISDDEVKAQLAKTSSGEGKNISKILTAKEGKSIVVEMDDGTVKKLTGDRNWRNNNPGNLEASPWTKKQPGYLGTDGRFAIFSTPEQGREAKNNLLFNTYKDKTIGSAIEKFAPSVENDTASYVARVSKQIGVSPGTRLQDLTPEQKMIMLDAMKSVEGGKTGQTEILKKGLEIQGTPTDNQIAEAKTQIQAQREQAGADTLAARAKLPAGVNSQFAQEYNKMTPGQKNATLTAIERTGVDKFNSIYKENPQQTIQTAAAGAPGAVKLFRTASGSGSDSSIGLKDFGDSQYGAESLSQLTQVGSKVGGTHEITAGGPRGQGSLKGLCGRGSRGVVGALLNHKYFAEGIGGNADSLSRGNPYLQKSGMYKAPTSLDKKQMTKEYLDSLPIGTVISSTGGGKGYGHVQVKGPGGTWISDGIQTKVLTSGYGNHTVHLPNENAIKRMNPTIVGADPATFAYAQSQGYIIPVPTPEQVAKGVPGAPPPSKEEAKENQAKIADATVKKESVDKEELAKAEDLQQEAQATVSQQPREQPGAVKLFKTAGATPPAEVEPPKESSTTTPIAQQQMAQSTNEVIPVLADGGAKELNTEKITAYPIGTLKGDNSVVVDDNKKPLFTMNTDKESAHYDPVDKTVSVKPLDEKKTKLDKKPMVGKAIPVLAEGGEVDLQASAQGEPVSKVDSEGLKNPETNNAAEPEAASNVGAMAQNAAMGPAPATTASIAENLRNMSANPITCPSFGRAIAASNFKKSGDHYDGGATNVK
jgi:hypothetical protein